MEVITMESDAYKRLVNKIEQIADFVTEAKLPSEEKKEAWLDSNQLADALGISTRTLQRLRDEPGRCNGSGTTILSATRCFGDGACTSSRKWSVVWKNGLSGASRGIWRIFAGTI